MVAKIKEKVSFGLQGYTAFLVTIITVLGSFCAWSVNNMYADYQQTKSNVTELQMKVNVHDIQIAEINAHSK